MEEKRGTYFIENETRVNRILIRVCLALLIFPPLAAVARWKLQYSALDYTDIIVIGIGLVLIIGLALTRAEATALLEKIVQDVYSDRGDADIKAWLSAEHPHRNSQGTGRRE